MRNIKFRGKKKIDDKWLFGDLIHDNIGGSYIYSIDCENLYKENAVNPDSVGQFTELYDKHDDEIYYGDFILWDKDNMVYYVTFKNGMFYASCHECNPNLNGGYPLWMLVNMGCSIIGNIHDNPDLLNNTKEK